MVARMKTMGTSCCCFCRFPLHVLMFCPLLFFVLLTIAHMSASLRFVLFYFSLSRCCFHSLICSSSSERERITLPDFHSENLGICGWFCVHLQLSHGWLSAEVCECVRVSVCVLYIYIYVCVCACACAYICVCVLSM
jgi:hypothetical protein